MSEPLLSIDAGSLAKTEAGVVRLMAQARDNAVSITTKALERRLEDAIRSAVPGRLYRAWGSRVFRGDGAVFVAGGPRSIGAMQFWTRPGTVRGKREQFLAVPLPAAGRRGRNNDLTPAAWEARTGLKLRFVPRPGRAALLVVDDAVLSGKAQTARGNTAKRIAAGRRSATVPIFVLVPVVRFGNRVAVQPIIARAQGDLTAEYGRQIASTAG